MRNKVIRVIYRWSVDADRRGAFIDWWREGTLQIRSTREGALGSTLLGSTTDDACFAAVARWRSMEDLEAFWNEGRPEFPGSRLDSVEIFEELDDLTEVGGARAQ
jgi:heme-degrading monooxygenase HmoA